MLKSATIIVANFSMFMSTDYKFILSNVKSSIPLKFPLSSAEAQRVFFPGGVDPLSNVRSHSGLI